jgi:hypothetical protein
VPQQDAGLAEAFKRSSTSSKSELQMPVSGRTSSTLLATSQSPAIDVLHCQLALTGNSKTHWVMLLRKHRVDDEVRRIRQSASRPEEVSQPKSRLLRSGDPRFLKAFK